MSSSYFQLLNATPRLCDPGWPGSSRVDLGVAGRIFFQEESLIRGVEPRSQRPATAGVSRKLASHTGLRWHLDLDWKRSICLLLPMVGSLSDVREYLRPSKEFQSLTKRRRRLGICWILRCAGPCFACPNGGRQGLIHCPPLMLLESVRADSDFETLRF